MTLIVFALCVGASIVRADPPAGKAPAPAVVKLGVPPPQNLFIMIRTTLIALQQANVTGNYSVLRDLGAPDFRSANSPERLQAAFAELRLHGGDIAQVVLLTPMLSSPPAVDGNGMLHLTGSFQTKPNPLDFDLLFQATDRVWQLYGIGVQFRSSMATQATDALPSVEKKADAALKNKTSAKK